MFIHLMVPPLDYTALSRTSLSTIASHSRSRGNSRLSVPPRDPYGLVELFPFD